MTNTFFIQWILSRIDRKQPVWNVKGIDKNGLLRFATQQKATFRCTRGEGGKGEKKETKTTNKSTSICCNQETHNKNEKCDDKVAQAKYV